MSKPGDALLAETRRHPVAQRYLEELEVELREAGLPVEESSEILADLDSHFAEAGLGGQPIDRVLQRLGPIDELVRAYCVALALGVRLESKSSATDRGSAAGRSLAAELSRRVIRWSRAIARTCLVGLLSTLGVALLLAGASGALAALVLPLVSASYLDPNLRFGVPQLVVLFASALAFVVGFKVVRLARLAQRASGLPSARTEPSVGATESRDEGGNGGSDSPPPVRAIHAESFGGNISRPEVEAWRREP